MNASGTPNTCKSNETLFVAIQIKNSGKRASNTYLICPEDGDNYGDIANPQYYPMNENSRIKDLSLLEEGASYQVVGEVIAHQAYDG